MAETFQQMVQDMLNQAVTALNDPNNPYYLPKFLQTSTPVYDPYNQPGTWNFPLATNEIQSAAATICTDIATGSLGAVCKGEPPQYIIDPSITPTLTLGGPNVGDLIITGFSNAIIPTGGLTANGGGIPLPITANITFSTLAPIVYPTIVGNFTLTQNCCCSVENANVCAIGTSTQYTGSGTFTTTVNGSASASLGCTVQSVARNNLTLSVDSIVLNAPLDGGGAPNLNTVVQILSIPKGANQQSYNNLANKAFNYPDARTQIMKQINIIMNEPAARQTVCTALQTVMNNYILANNLYPYDNATLELF